MPQRDGAARLFGTYIRESLSGDCVAAGRTQEAAKGIATAANAALSFLIEATGEMLSLISMLSSFSSSQHHDHVHLAADVMNMRRTPPLRPSSPGLSGGSTSVSCHSSPDQS
jgi:hypothetical protein